LRCFFASDLHGHVDRYRKLLDRMVEERPELVLLGGDLLPSFSDRRWMAGATGADFVGDFLAAEFGRAAERLGASYPRVLLILGNDDPRFQEAAFLAAAGTGVWTYAHDRRVTVGEVTVCGYTYVPPTPFLLKDWERYDVSRFVDPGCVSPEEGQRTVPVSPNEVRYGTIQRDLATLFGSGDLGRTIGLFHAPPYRTTLDRAALDGMMVDHAPLDVHIGSIAIRRFIEQRQPLLTLHGHVHESTRLTGAWRDRLGRTHLFSAAHDGPELALVRFDTNDPDGATRVLW